MKNPMEKRQILNIINFIRGVEPREDVDLLEPVRNQIILMKKHKLKGTFLLQYDALCNPMFTDMLKELDKSQFEIGVWFEIVQPMVEKAGLNWKGRYPWWHAYCGFSRLYGKGEERFIDILLKILNHVLGTILNPLIMGFDAHSLNMQTVSMVLMQHVIVRSNGNRRI